MSGNVSLLANVGLLVALAGIIYLARRKGLRAAAAAYQQAYDAGVHAASAAAAATGNRVDVHVGHRVASPSVSTGAGLDDDQRAFLREQVRAQLAADRLVELGRVHDSDDAVGDGVGGVLYGVHSGPAAVRTVHGRVVAAGPVVRGPDSESNRVDL